MYLHVKGVTTWGAAVDCIIKAQHRWPVDERGRVDLTPPDEYMEEPQDWLIECEPALSAHMSAQFGQWVYDHALWFKVLTVREASPDRVNILIGAPLLPGFELV